MKIWFEWTPNYLIDDEHLQLGIISYRHKRKEWKGFTVSLLLFNSGFSLNAVTNYAEYTRVMKWFSQLKKNT